MSTNITEVTGKAFVDPGIAPPITSDQVTKPLMCELVRNQGRSVVLDTHDGFTWVNNEVQLSEIRKAIKYCC